MKSQLELAIAGRTGQRRAVRSGLGLRNRLILAARSSLLLWPAVILLLFFAGALVNLFQFSLYRFDPSQLVVESQVTLENYAKAVGDSFYLGTLLVTFKLSVVVTVTSIVLGFPIAYWIVRTNSPNIRAGVISLVAIPFMTSLIVRLYSLTMVLGNSGLINTGLRGAGFVAPDDFVPLIRNELGVAIGLTYFVLPFVVFTLTSALRRLDRTLEEAAQNLGADEISTFARVTLPLSLPGVVGAAMLAFALSVTAFTTPLILGGAAVRMIANLVYDQVLFVHNVPFGSALAVIALAVTFMILYVHRRVTGRSLA